MDLTEAEDIKKRRQEHTEELYKKDLQDPDNHDGVITHLEPDILECEVKWALESITTNKASGGDGIPVELFQILKDLGPCGDSSATPSFPWQPEGKIGLPRANPRGRLSTTRISGSLSCGAREVRSPCAWRGGARPGSRVTGGD